MWFISLLLLGTFTYGFWLVMLLGVPAYVVFDQVLLPLVV